MVRKVIKVAEMQGDARDTVGLSVDEYADIKVFMKSTEDKIEGLDTKVDKVEGKLDKLIDRIEDHMGYEEKVKKKLLWIGCGIGILYVLQTLGLPVGELLTVLKVFTI